MFKRKYRTVYSASLVVTALTLSSIAFAYSLNTARWASRTVNYYVNPINSDVSESAALAAVQVGARAWSDQSTANIELVYAGPTTVRANNFDNVNEVFFSPSSGSGGTLAVTYSVYDASGNLLDTDIEFFDGNRLFFTGDTGCSGGSYIEDVAAHEFGHALGLNHSSVADATMAPSIPTCLNTRRFLDADDIAGIQAKYPSPCDVDGNGVSVTDVQRLVNQAIGLASCTADINGDGACNVIDVQRVVNAALGQGCNTR